MKKFKKSKRIRQDKVGKGGKKEFTDNKDKCDISSLYYWGEKNILISSSWDSKVRLYDDSTADQEGSKRYSMKKHKDSVNFIDFKLSHQLCASCSDDCTVVIYNYGSYRQEGILKVPIDSTYKESSELKICKFLSPSDCLVAADIDGFLHFFAVTPSPRKNEHLCKVSNFNTSQVGTQVNYPIRAMDFDSDNNILYTGDEMGYI